MLVLVAVRPDSLVCLHLSLIMCCHKMIVVLLINHFLNFWMNCVAKYSISLSIV